MIKLQRGTLLTSVLTVAVFAKIVLSVPALPEIFGMQGSAMAAVNTDKPTAGAGAQTAEGPPKAIIDQKTVNEAINKAPEELLSSIRKERKPIDAQRQELGRKKAEMALAEENLTVKQNALEELKNKVQDLLKRVKASQTQDLNRLVAFYQNMKPADAARIMEGMDIEVTILVMTSMKPRDGAPILAKMNPIRARAISKIILERSKLPADQNLNGIRLN